MCGRQTVHNFLLFSVSLWALCFPGAPHVRILFSCCDDFVLWNEDKACSITNKIRNMRGGKSERISFLTCWNNLRQFLNKVPVRAKRWADSMLVVCGFHRLMERERGCQKEVSTLCSKVDLFWQGGHRKELLNGNTVGWRFYNGWVEILMLRSREA